MASNSLVHNFKDINLEISHGDLYIMSEKATGFDWKKRDKVRVFHASGHKSYIDKGFQTLEEKKKLRKRKLAIEKSIKIFILFIFRDYK